MKIVDIFHLPRRGYVALVEDLPAAPVRLGDVVRQGGNSWEIKAVETQPRGTHPERWGFILSPLHGSPDWPEKGELTL